MSLSEERNCLLNMWFSDLEGIGLKTKIFLRHYFGNLEQIYNLSALDIEELKELCKDNDNVAVKNIDLNMILEHRSLEEVKRKYDKLNKLGIDVVYPGHCNYPDKLMHIYLPPQILYIKGHFSERINNYDCNVAIVGSRKADTYGKEMTSMFSRELSKNNINIISGLAYGVDGIAHRACLDAGGYTVGVLGCGINIAYPRTNIELFARMENEGCIISEYGLDEAPLPAYFPQRNRIISGLSDGVLVVQAQKKSGSLITADCALEQGKQVYAIPGRLYDPGSEGTNNLIKMGAYAVTMPEDIIRDLKCEKNIVQDDLKSKENDWEDTLVKPKIKKVYNMSGEKNYNKPDVKMNENEKMIYDMLTLDPIYIEEIISRLNMSVSSAVNILFNMEQMGMIKQPVKGYYIKQI